MIKQLLEIYREVYHIDLKVIYRKKPYNWRILGKAFGELFIYLGKTAKDLLLYRNSCIHGSESVAGKVWLVVGTKNNVDTLNFLKDQLEDSVFVSINKKMHRFGGFTRLSFQMSFFHWWKAPALIWGLWPYFGIAILFRFDKFLEGVGLFEASTGILKRYCPRALIFANDHAPYTRALLWAALKMDIPTIYLQHASISADFPPLRFGLSLLEGQDTLDKYRRCGPVKGKVKLVGMPKFDPYLTYRNKRKIIQNIGLCANIWDDWKRLEIVLKTILEKFPEISLTFRPHPGDDRSFDLPSDVHFSNSKKESVFDFLTKQDLIIAGDTSLHLEAILLNVNSLYFPFSDYVSDVYGYVENGLVKKIKLVDKLMEWIASNKGKPPEVWQKAKYYNAVIGTAHEGKSSELAIKYILQLLKNPQ